MNFHYAFTSGIPLNNHQATVQTSPFLNKIAPVSIRRAPQRRLRANPQSANIQCRDNFAPASIGRDEFLRLVICGAATALVPLEHARADEELSTYNGPLSLGFSFSYPASWVVKKKPIKTHLSEINVTSDTKATTTAGLVVDAVKIDAIDKFGAPDVVGKKVVDLEMKKDSVTSASVIAADSFTKDDLTYYLIEYEVSSSRGEKHFLAKATVTGGQLYVFTAQASVGDYNGATEQCLKSTVESFTVKKQYL